MEEEDITDWIHIEPPMQQRVFTSLSSNKSAIKIKKNYIENKKNNINTENNISTEDNIIIIRKLNKKIQCLKSQNIILRKQVRNLKYRLQRIPKIRKMPKKEKEKKTILKKLINEQDLHPVAKAMVNLQLHVPNAAYTEEEKNLSRQLYYYSAAAFCRLRKAGCNFPGQRTIKR
jgi:hypothetical protein